MMMCKNNCGFYGNESFQGYCSQCFKSLVTPATKEICQTNPIEIIENKMPKPINRCLTCRKKIGIYGFSCKCDGYYCTVHRYPESHDCSFDYKNMGREKIEKENPVIIAKKIEDI